MAAVSPVIDRPLLGITLMLGFCVLAPLGDSLAKILGPVVPLGMLILVRFAIQPLILAPVALLTGTPLRVPRHLVGRILLRTVLHITGIACMFSALRYMPLADTVAIAFVMPFIMLLLGKLVLDEEVGPHRLSACAVGFAGTLLVIQPNFAEVGWPALLPVVVAVVFSLFMLVTRQIAKEIDAISLQAASGAMATALLVPVMAFGPGWDSLALVWPDGRIALLLLALGVVGTLAHLMMTWSLRFAPSATLAPMQYLEIPVATLFGWLIFRDLPNGLAALGIAVTIAAGLYVIWREQAIARPRPAAPR
jgi:drug/metabolite transporter (DMT)-like permease